MALFGKLNSLWRLMTIGLLTAALGCASSSGQGGGPEESPAAHPASPESTPHAAVSPTAPTPSKPETPPESKEAPRPPAEIQEKLQPGEAAPRTATKPDEATLKAEAEVFVKRWLEALQKGDVTEAEKFTVSSDLLNKTMNPGYRDILEGTVLSQNRLITERLIALLKGKKVQHDWKPGSISDTPARHIFVSSVPCMSAGIVQVDASGIVAEVHLDQLFYLEGQWKIFRMSVP